MSPRQIQVEIVGDAKKLNAALDDAGKKTGKFSSIITGVGQGIGQAGFGAVQDAIGGTIGFLKDANQAFVEDAASQDLLKAALKSNVGAWNGSTDSIEKVIGAQMRLGFGDEEQRESLANLIGITKDVGAAQKLQTEAMDLARLKGMSLASASDLLGKVYGGNLGTLSRYGIVLDDNATKEDALAAIQAMAGGQAEAYAQGPLGIQTAAQIKVGESMEKVGSIINGVATAAIPVLADAFANVVDWIANTWTAIGPGVTLLVHDLTPAFKMVAGIIGTVIGILMQVARVVLPIVWGAVKVLASIWGTAFGVIRGVISGAAGFIGGVVGGIKGVITGIGSTVTGVKDTVVGAFNNIVSFITGLPGRIAGAARGMWDGIWNAFRGAINAIIGAWNGIKFDVPAVNVGPVHIGGFSVGTPNIPYLHAGGMVPGIPGSDVLTMLQAGERVIPRSMAASSQGGNVTINIESFVGSDQDIEKFADRIAMRLRTAPR